MTTANRREMMGMTYVNCGAYVDGERPKTKKALREALNNHSYVDFDVTTIYRNRGGEIIEATPDGIGTDTISVVGPDPYASRRWYASVTVKNGRVVIS